MNWNLFWLFVVLNVVNVIVQTVKSIATIRCGKLAAALVNAGAYSLYTIVTVFMLCELDLWLKALVVGLANLVGVYVVKALEEKTKKERLWKVEATLPHDEKTIEQLKLWSDIYNIPCNYIDINKYYVINIYCATQKQSALARDFLERFNAKYFVSESKTL